VLIAAIPVLVVAVIALLVHVVDHLVAAVLLLAVRAAAVTGFLVAVIAFLIHVIDDLISAELVQALSATAIPVLVVAVVALLGGFHLVVSAAGRDGLVDASHPRLATVRRAFVVILAFQGLSSGHADTPHAGIPYGARVIVVAGLDGGHMGTAGPRFAGVRSTNVAVVARGLTCPRETDTVKALVTSSARVAVVAGGHVVHVDAPDVVLANVVGAGIHVVAFDELAGGALAGLALVSDGAQTSVVTGPLGGGKGTTGLGEARVVGAWVVVRTGELPRRNALSQVAVISRGAEVVIVAW